MGRLALIRMGKTVWDTQYRISGDLEVPLLSAEEGEFETLFKKIQSLSFFHLFSSPTRAARETTERLAQKLHLPFTLLETLTELNLGLWQGMLESEIQVKHARAYQVWQRTPSQICPPFGETLGECQQRLVKSLRRIFRRKKKNFQCGVVLPPYAKALLDLHLQQKPLDALFQILHEEENEVTSYQSYMI